VLEPAAGQGINTQRKCVRQLGEVAEWSIAAVLKTAEVKASVGLTASPAGPDKRKTRSQNADHREAV